MIDCCRLLNPTLQAQYRGRHAAESAIVVLRSPWQAQDVYAACQDDRFKDAVLIGVNFAVLEYRLNYCMGGDPAFWYVVDPRNHPKTMFITGFNPGPPKNTGGNLTDMQLTIPKSTVNAQAALWWAWHTGANPIFIAGAHHRMDGQTFYGDFDLKDMFADDLERKLYVRRYLARFPMLAREMLGFVGELRRAGRTVVWPGEESSRQVVLDAGQDVPSPERARAPEGARAQAGPVGGRA